MVKEGPVPNYYRAVIDDDRVGGEGDDYLRAVTGASDGGWLACGYYKSNQLIIEGRIFNNKGNNDGIAIKYNEDGEIEWAKSIGDVNEDYLTSVCEINGNGYVVGGYFRGEITIDDEFVTSNGSNDLMILKLSKDGATEWIRAVGGTDSEQLTALTPTTDGGIIIGGTYVSEEIILDDYVIKRSNSSNKTESMIIKYSEEGEQLWATEIGDDDDIIINSISEIKEEEFIIGGRYSGSITVEIGKATNNLFSSNYDAMLLKIIPEKEKIVSNVLTSETIGAISSNDGGYVVAGRYDNTKIIGHHTLSSAGWDDIYIAKFNSSDHVEWVTSIGGTTNDGFSAIIETSDGGILIKGNVGNNTLVGNKVISGCFLAKYSSEGNFDWVTNIPPGSMILKNDEGGCYITGYFDDAKVQIGDTIINNDSIKYYSYGGEYRNYEKSYISKFKYDGSIEWIKTLEGPKAEKIKATIVTEDGGCLVGGVFSTEEFRVGDHTLINQGGLDGMVIKYSKKGDVEWASSIYGESDLQDSKEEVVEYLIQTPSGGYAVAGNFNSYKMQIGDFELTNGSKIHDYGSNGEQYLKDIFLIEYSHAGIPVWAKRFGNTDIDTINALTLTNDGNIKIYYNETYHLRKSVTISENGIIEEDKYLPKQCSYPTSDDGYISMGQFSNSLSIAKNNTVYSKGDNDVYIIKYDSSYDVEWYMRYGGEKSDSIQSIMETLDGGYIVTGETKSNDIKIGKYKVSNSKFAFKLSPIMEVEDKLELEVRNNRKEYNITTQINTIDNIKGGTISGEGVQPFEIVKYGDSNAKEIKMVPDENYEIIGITINGKEWSFVSEPDGTYTLPTFENIHEDKHIIVTYSLKDNKITINKKDSVSGEALEGAKFKLDQIEERTEPDNNEIIGDLANNGEIYTVSDYDKEVVGFIDLSTDLKYVDGVNYYFVPKTNEDNTYVISAKSTDAVYLNLTSGLCPHNAEARNIEVRNGETEGTFKLYDKEQSSHLHFWASPNTKGDRTFDRCGTSCGTNDDFEIYKPSTSVTSDIEGYEKVTALSDLENGVYLIVSKSTADDNYYALRPVISDNKYDHVAKVLK